MVVYIAGKITGCPNYKDLFAAAEKELAAEGDIVLNPSVFPEGLRWEQYMSICVPMLMCADAIYMLNNWRESKGARIELEIALNSGKEVMYQGCKKY